MLNRKIESNDWIDSIDSIDWIESIDSIDSIDWIGSIGSIGSPRRGVVDWFHRQAPSLKASSRGGRSFQPPDDKVACGRRRQRRRGLIGLIDQIETIMNSQWNVNL
ncbi:MAG: hypothetical protein H6562_22040 [Lewinellaceae bacterium]|nr:hypothetical protein [Lewinellaceae bacterium]